MGTESYPVLGTAWGDTADPIVEPACRASEAVSSDDPVACPPVWDDTTVCWYAIGIELSNELTLRW